MTVTAANFVIIMKAVGCCVAFLSHPGNGVSVVSTWTRSVLSLRRHSSSASNHTSPRASIRSGFFSNRLWTMSGSFKKPKFCSIPCCSL
jgi:hypothetical protein